MKKEKLRICLLMGLIGIGLSVVFSLAAFRQKEKTKIGFLIHDLVSERWKKDTDMFENKINELGGEVILENAFGDATTQIRQGKALIDKGIKVIVVVAKDGKALGELVEYANKHGAKIIAYNRLILNCDLEYYISYNSMKVGEMMADYALLLKPKGNYMIIDGPSSDNNAILIKRGIMNKLKKPIDKGNIKIVLQKEVESWASLNSYMAIEEFISSNKVNVDVIIAANDELATGAVEAFKASQLNVPTVVIGQDATRDACKNIILGNQTMTVYKSIKKLSSQAAIMAMKLAQNEKVKTTSFTNNGKHKVPSILFDPVSIDKFNLRKILIVEEHIKESDLN